MKHKPIIYGVSSFLGTVLASKITKSVLPKDKTLESNLILASSAGIAAYISSRKASEYSTAINLGLTAGVVTSVLISRDKKSLSEEDFSGEAIVDVNVEKIPAEDSLPFVPGEIIWEGLPQEINTGGLFNMVNFLEDPTYDLKPYGDFAERRDRPIKRFIIHHGGYNLSSLTAAFKDPTRTASSHFGIELQPDGTVNVAKLQDEDEVYYLLIFRDISSENAKEEELKRIANNAKKENDELASQLLKEKRLKSQMALLTKIYKATVGLIIMLGALIGLSWVFPKENSTESLAMIERILLVITGILGSATASMFDSKNQSNNEDQ